MKKICFVLMMLIMIASHGSAAEAKIDESAGDWEKVGYVVIRGFGNFLGAPLELPRTMVQELNNHPKAWPFTFIPKTLSHIFIRGASALNDVLFFPPMVPFSNDISSWAEQIGLSEYPWQWHEEDLG